MFFSHLFFDKIPLKIFVTGVKNPMNPDVVNIFVYRTKLMEDTNEKLKNIRLMSICKRLNTLPCDRESFILMMLFRCAEGVFEH